MMTATTDYMERLAEAQRIWGAHILYWLREGNLQRAVACLYQYRDELDVMDAEYRAAAGLARP